MNSKVNTPLKSLDFKFQHGIMVKSNSICFWTKIHMIVNIKTKQTYQKIKKKEDNKKSKKKF